MANREIELSEFDVTDVDRLDELETEIDLPDVPIDLDNVQSELIKTNFVSDVRKNLRVTGSIDSTIYRGLTLDGEGQIFYNHKRITYKSGRMLKLYSVKSLLKNPDSREFRRLIGYTSEKQIAPMAMRDVDTVMPEQTAAMQSKIDSCKITEDWAKQEKEKATRQLEQTSDQGERLKLQESVQYFDRMDAQARRRYNEVVQNQFKRINTIIHDETRSLGERLRELFRRDGLTVGALITTIGMTISTIVLAVLPQGNPTPNKSSSTYVDKFVKKPLIKLANFLLDLVKKALAALPGLIGSLVSFLLKTAGELVLFLSEYLIVLFLALVMAIFEFFFKRLHKTRAPR
jgi:hypothetical protein